MKKKALGVLALTGTLFVQLAGAGASVAAERPVIAKPVVTKTVMTGQRLTAEFEGTEGCIRTRIFVFGSVSLERLGVVSVTQENTCTLTTLINGFGETDTLDMAVPNALGRGHLRMSMEFTDSADPDNPVVSPMTADVSFRATAKATTTSTKFRSFSEGTRFVSSAGTKIRAASATGTITLGTQKVLSPDTSSYFATIGSAVSTEKTIARPAKSLPVK